MKFIAAALGISALVVAAALISVAGSLALIVEVVLDWIDDSDAS